MLYWHRKWVGVNGEILYAVALPRRVKSPRFPLVRRVSGP
jgi:hypothetical protein